MMAGALFFGPTPAEDALDRITEMLKDAQLTPLSRGGVTARPWWYPSNGG